MGIPNTYQSGDIDKQILKPSIKALTGTFQNIMYTKIKQKGRGRGGKVVAIEFVFKPQTNTNNQKASANTYNRKPQSNACNQKASANTYNNKSPSNAYNQKAVANTYNRKPQSNACNNDELHSLNQFIQQYDVENYPTLARIVAMAGLK